ncbi:hypothetical protein [Aliivibrio sp. SR45-2]|uniref:hypothetical protein n=1 Tax=Aliivibrio sp. SR45-2 TaxID=2760931 RepID=UPI0015F9D5EF|nr:hypothetical protein [Aliivibrio sp. SR45-2]MBB1313414.1 hypothetical protein [Aliivibrio sp. SR45-2]
MTNKPGREDSTSFNQVKRYKIPFRAEGGALKEIKYTEFKGGSKKGDISRPLILPKSN